MQSPWPFKVVDHTPLPIGKTIRVLIVDDSVVVRRMLSQIVKEESSFELVGFAGNGSSALTQDVLLHPDVITMDVEMPEMDGLAAVRALRGRGSKAIIIMCSTLTRHGAEQTVEALMVGANDYVTKPAANSSISGALDALRQELIPKVKQFFISVPPENLSLIRSAGQPSNITNEQPLITEPSGITPARLVVAIGVSTGGPTALIDLLPRLPENFHLPIVIVQHMPPIFTRQLADRLNKVCNIEVLEATDGMLLAPGLAVLAPGDHHMRLKQSARGVAVSLDQKPRENSCRPSVDVLFNSVVELYGGRTIGIILTGMGQDGLRGVEALKAKGAYIIAQNRESSVVWGMPGVVVHAGLSDETLHLHDIGDAILRQVAAR